MIQLGAHGALEWLPGKAVGAFRSLRAGSASRPRAVDLPFHR